MRHEIAYRPTFAQLEVPLERDETVRAEAGAMLDHSRGIDLETGTSGGLVRSLKRSVLGGESFFPNDFTARGPGSVTFAATSERRPLAALRRSETRKRSMNPQAVGSPEFESLVRSRR